VAPAVIVAVGSDVMWQLRQTYSELRDTVPDNYRIQDIEGTAFPVHDAGMSLNIIASPHLTGAFGLSGERITAVGRAARRCLRYAAGVVVRSDVHRIF
jgi:hypothetical protein